MVIVKNIEKVDLYNDNFKILGYECMGEFGIAGRRYFRKGGDNRTHQIHVFEETNSTDIIRHLAVKNYLQLHNDVARDYGELKEKLAQEYPQDIDGYCDGKEDFMKELEINALEWYKSK